jgi:lipoprotein-anchoring transpeptidase ErfK/SrfK
VRTLFGVLGVVMDRRCEPSWFHVQLPIRPNGATGYVRAGAVSLARVHTHIVIDLSERRVELFSNGRRIVATTAAVGSRATPTPTGHYYVNQEIRVTDDPTGPFGPGAIGISAFSPVLTGWAQGGPIAIHGTDEPVTIGHAASTGCLRVRNDVLLRLFRLTPPGTPVLIRA